MIHPNAVNPGAPIVDRLQGSSLRSLPVILWMLRRPSEVLGATADVRAPFVHVWPQISFGFITLSILLLAAIVSTAALVAPAALGAASAASVVWTVVALVGTLLLYVAACGTAGVALTAWWRVPRASWRIIDMSSVVCVGLLWVIVARWIYSTIFLTIAVVHIELAGAISGSLGVISSFAEHAIIWSWCNRLVTPVVDERERGGVYVMPGLIFGAHWAVSAAALRGWDALLQRPAFEAYQYLISLF